MTLADKIRPHVSRIIAAAENGDGKAQQIINLYQMHVASPADPGAPALCKAAFHEWMATNETA